MRAAAALEAFESASLISASLGFFLSRRKAAAVIEPAVDAVAALRHLLLDIGGLQWMRFFRSAKTRKRGDSWRHRPLEIGVMQERDRLAVDVHGAGAALRQPRNRNADC